MRLTSASLALFTVLFSHAAAAKDDGPAFEEIFQDEGITVWRREIPGTSLVEFRGRGVVKAPIVKIAAVIRDDTRKTEWMKNCVGAATVRYTKTGQAVVYNRTGSPVPLVSDRDIVLLTKVNVDAAKRAVVISFSQVEDPKMPPVDGVVRMPQLKGYWKLEQVDKGSTRVTYQVQADPGGLLPKWLVNWVNKKLPFHTVNNLRGQSGKAGYEKVEGVVMSTIDWTGFDI